MIKHVSPAPINMKLIYCRHCSSSFAPPIATIEGAFGEYRSLASAISRRRQLCLTQIRMCLIDSATASNEL